MKMSKKTDDEVYRMAKLAVHYAEHQPQFIQYTTQKLNDGNWQLVFSLKLTDHTIKQIFEKEVKEEEGEWSTERMMVDANEEVAE